MDNPFKGQEQLLDATLREVLAKGINPAMLVAWSVARIEAPDYCAECFRDGGWDEPPTNEQALELMLEADLDCARDYVLSFYEDFELAIAAADDAKLEPFHR